MDRWQTSTPFGNILTHSGVVGRDIARLAHCLEAAQAPSRFPPIQLFERVANPDDLDAISELEGLTNPRIRCEVGDLEIVPPSDRVGGPGTSVIMVALSHLNPGGSRFSDGTYGVYHAVQDFDTAVAETKHHRERFPRNTVEARIELDMRVYLGDLEGERHALHGQNGNPPLVIREDNYAECQKLGKELRDAGSNGIVYDSIRREGGKCV